MAVNPLETNKNRALHLCAALFFIASPLLIMLILSALAGQNMFLAKPYLNDEVDYWRVMYSVKECGLNFGPTGGLPGRNAPIGPLESHGLGPLAAWLWYALCFPFTESALVIASFVMLTLALLLFYLIVKPSDKQAILMAAFILCFPPLVRYINLSMMEIPCYAAVIVYIALLCRYEKSRSLSCLVLLLLSGLYCSLLRLSNVVLFFPAILIFCDNRWSWKLLWCLLAYVLGVLLLNSFVNLFIAPYPDFVSSLSACSSWKEVLLTLLRNLLGNLRNMLNPFSDHSLPQAVARYYYLALVLFFLAASFFKVSASGLRLTWRWEYVGMLGVAAGSLALVLLLYDVFDWRDYRTLSPMAFVLVLWLLLRWPEEGRGFRAALATLLVFGALMAPNSYRHAAQDDRFFDTGRTGADYSQLFCSEPCTLGLYGDTYPLSLAMDVPPQVGISSGLYEDRPDCYGMDYVLSRAGDPIPSEEYFSPVGEMEGYGMLYKRKQ